MASRIGRKFAQSFYPEPRFGSASGTGSTGGTVVEAQPASRAVQATSN